MDTAAHDRILKKNKPDHHCIVQDFPNQSSVDGHWACFHVCLLNSAPNVHKMQNTFQNLISSALEYNTRRGVAELLIEALLGVERRLSG